MHDIKNGIIGLHPWNVDEKWRTAVEQVERDVATQNAHAIGECGLDTLRGPDLPMQIAAFRAQCHVAERVQKPVVIHCVRAFDELIRVRREIRPRQHWIVHGFNKSGDVLERLLEEGFYISFSGAIQRVGSPAREAAQRVPLDRMFLETDDDPKLRIETVYEAAAALRGVTVEELCEILQKNFTDVFGQ
jgi:TatD DNase family protein